jgi:RNA polymerase sigma-70 factor (ECF subfamily)
VSTFTPAQPTDADLLSSARDGDADSFGLLFERHAAAVLRFCFRRTGNAASAEDLTSIVFLVAWEQREKTVFYEGRARPWLLGVALNVLRSQSRAERRYRDLLARIPAAATPEPESDGAIARLDAERQMHEVFRAVSKLGRREREVVELCVWEGLSTEEAGRVLDIAPGAVRSRLSRARRRLPLLEAALTAVKEGAQ